MAEIKLLTDNFADSDNGNKIVICTEGNGGFYEVGIMATPLDAGFSVIGWNHPGTNNGLLQ